MNKYSKQIKKRVLKRRPVVKKKKSYITALSLINITIEEVYLTRLTDMKTEWTPCKTVYMAVQRRVGLLQYGSDLLNILPFDRTHSRFIISLPFLYSFQRENKFTLSLVIMGIQQRNEAVLCKAVGHVTRFLLFRFLSHFRWVDIQYVNTMRMDTRFLLNNDFMGIFALLSTVWLKIPIYVIGRNIAIAYH